MFLYVFVDGFLFLPVRKVLMVVFEQPERSPLLVLRRENMETQTTT